jgi:S-DNA-T family DNA segregation ATPase FtsK/SpoIIIE
MPTSRRLSSPLAEASELLREFLGRRAAELTGFALVTGAAAMALALATWSVDDPSLNHATRGAIRNWLGFPGAVMADLTMQLVGLAAIALLVPLGLWGLALMRRRELPFLRMRLAAWVIAVTAGAALAATLPATARWPLPTGLGGVLGDACLNLAKAVFGINARLGLVLAGIAFAIVTILALTACCGLGLTDEVDAAPAARNGRGTTQREEEEDERPQDEPGWGLVSLGAIVHLFMVARSALSRGSSALRRRAAARVLPSSGRQEPALSVPHGDLTVDPSMATLPRNGLSRPSQRPDAAARLPRAPHAPVDLDEQDPFDDDPFPQDDGPARKHGVSPRDTERPEPLRAAARRPAAVEPDDDDDFEDDQDDDPLPPLPAPQASRVVPPPPPPKPGKRIVKEAQPSFLDNEGYQLPALTLLGEPRRGQAPLVSQDALDQNATLLEGVLDDFGVRGSIINVHPGPVVTLYELEPAPGTKSSRVISLADDIARSMSAVSARVAVVPGRNAIGIELPNAKRETVFLRELLASQDFESAKAKLALCLGKTIGGEPVIVDLARMPHLLVAGTTGSGKSVAINTMILSLLYRLKPEECRLIMVDPKMLELSVYDGIPHLLTPVVTDPKKAVVALKWAVREMEERYKKMSKLGVRNIDGFNARVAEARARGEVIHRTVQTGFDRETGEAIYEDEAMDLAALPYIVVIVDEMADLMMVAGKEIEGTIQRLAQMARAAGIHVVLATQRPSVDVITGTIKANFPTRISFQVTSKIDSRTILGEQGAEQLLGQGDMLYMAGGGRITRVHGPFVSDDEVEKVVAHLKTQGRPNYLESVVSGDEDGGEAESADTPVFDQGAFGAPGGDLYDQAVAVVLRDKKASTSYIQRRLQIGYNRAASLMERMEKEGIVGPANHAGKREILLETGGRGQDDED